MATKRYSLQRSREAEQSNERRSRGSARRSTEALMSSNAWRRHCTEKQSRGNALKGGAAA